MTRACGDCTMCCTLLEIDELQKPRRTPCPHEHGRCSVYATRPDECRAFKCLWLAFDIPVGRPDISGIMLVAYKAGPSIVLYESEEHAFSDSVPAIGRMFARRGWHERAFIIVEMPSAGRFLAGGPADGVDFFLESNPEIARGAPHWIAT